MQAGMTTNQDIRGLFCVTQPKCTLSLQMVSYFYNVWLCLQKLARLLYNAVKQGLIDGAKVKNILQVTEQDAFKGKIIISY